MSGSSTRQFLLSILRPYRGWLGLLIFGTLWWTADLSLRPYILKILIDRLANLPHHTSIEPLLIPAFMYFGLSMVMGIVFRLYDYGWLKFNPPIKRDLGLALMKRLMGQSYAFFQNHFAGALGNRIKDVMSSVPDAIHFILEKLLNVIIGVSIAIGTLWSVNGKFALGLALWVGIFCTGSYLSSRRAQYYSMAAAQARSQAIGTLVDILGTISTVRLFAAKKKEEKIAYEFLDHYRKADQARDWFFLKINIFQALSFTTYTGICLWLLVTGYQEGTVSAGDFALILSINATLIDWLWSLSHDLSHFSEHTGNIAQGLSIALAPTAIKNKPNAIPLPPVKGEILFKNVDFHYQGATPLFKNLTVHIRPGEKVGLVGYSGSGKTTFANLLLRLFDITQGSITIDGISIQDIKQNSLRRQIGMIPQDPALFHRSIMENIRYGRPEATDEEVIEAAKKAYAHTFIMDLPQGYASTVGERGVKLSGGQRQRIAIARAFLKNAPILVLDEATSQLDSVTEQEIQESLWELMQGKTTLVIAHRLSTLLEMDRILVFDQGHIVEDASHADLIQQQGLYHRLWKTQIGGFLGDGTLNNLT